MSERSRQILIAAALIIGPDGRALLVRKRGTTAFMQPGGKIDAGETPVAALRRELREELSLDIGEDEPRYLGRFTAPAANEADATVVAEVYLLHVAAAVVPQAEIEVAQWVDTAEPGNIELAPLTGELIFPAYRLLLG
jgi:8-oxo-dGTP diphosphatase